MEGQVSVCFCQESAKNIVTYEIVPEEVRLQNARVICELAKLVGPSEWSGNYRCDNAYNKGGFELKNDEATQRMRGAMKEFVKLIGKKFWSGDFNLTRTSFPIKCMAKNTQLEMQTSIFNTFPSFVYYAATQTNDPVERIKYLITAMITGNYYSFMCVKPLNPILGETFQIYGHDGSK